MKIFEIGYSIENLEIIHSLEISCFPEDYWNQEQIKNQLLSNRTFIANVEEQNVGYVFIQDTDEEIEILKIGIIANHRKSGFGKNLIHHLQSKKKDIFLEVRADNLIAINLYIQTGFIKIHTRKKYYSDSTNAECYKWICK
jgi:ribosomal-protein-alanine N-acetyltransferase